MRVPTEANDHAAEAEAGELGDAGVGGGRHRIGRVRAFPRGEENSHATISTIARRRKISNNTKACPASEDAPFPVSGVGVALLGATGVNVAGNVITGNVPSAESDLSGGVVVTTGIGGSPPTNTHVHGNTILHNQPDLFWDGTGTGNAFQGNLCQTSSPVGLCH